MSVDNFIHELQERSLLSDRLVGKLREAAADPSRPLSARTLADFLVRKNHLSQEQATNVINSLQSAGVNVDKTGPPSTIISSLPMPQRRMDEGYDSDDDPDGSSIFAPFLTGAGAKKAGTSPSPPDDDDELTLVAIDEEEETTNAVVANDVATDDAPDLEMLKPAEDKPARPPSKPAPSRAIGST